MSFLVFVLICAAITTEAFRPTQWVSVSGKVTCKGLPASGVKVKVYDVDDFTLDDKLAEVVTGDDGIFHLKGHTNEITTIDPKLNIYHNCAAWTNICYIKFDVILPKNIVSRDEESAIEYDAGVFTLENEFRGQSKDCFNK